jgi:hypothetical protein
MRLHVIAPVLITSALITACGGGGGGTSSDPVTPVAATTTVSGVASKGPLKQALVSAYKVKADGTRGDLITSKETDDNGGYTLDLGSYTGPVQLEVTVVAGKTTTADEATGADQTLPDDFKLRSTLVVTAPTGGTQVQSASVTPYTEMATKIAEDSGGLNQTNIANATKVVFDLIGVDPVATKPIDYSKPAPADATEAQKKYALLNAAVSNLAAFAPKTTDPATLACFNSAGSTVGKKIKCATDQIAKAVTVDRSGATATAAVNRNFVGLGDALVAVSNDDRNKTGTRVAADDADSRRLQDIETEVKNAEDGKAPPIKLDVPVQDQADVAKAKLFFNRLRSNVASLQSAPLDTGLADGMRAFEASLRGEALKVAGDTAQLLRLTQMGLALWQDYTAGLTTNPNSVGVVGLPGGCTVFSGSFPTQFGGDAFQVGVDGAPGAAYPNNSVTATSAANASWVGCSLNQGVVPTAANGVVQYRRTILLNTAAATVPATIPYLAVTRARSYDANRGELVQRNLTPTLSGSFGAALANGNGLPATINLSGDLPPGVTTAGALMAARYPVRVTAVVSAKASTATEVKFSAGSIAVVPVGATTASLTVDLSADSASTVVAPMALDAAADAVPTAAQLADAKVTLAARISTARGALFGRLDADGMALDSFGDIQPRHLKFTGTISAAGTSGVVAEVLTGTLEGNRSFAAGASEPTDVIGFTGSLSLPGRPGVTLSLSATKTPATASAAASVAVTGRYVQDAVSMQATGRQSGSSKSLTLEDSSGVSVSMLSASTSAAVTVSGRNAATIDMTRGRVTYVDGSFESLN